VQYTGDPDTQAPLVSGTLQGMQPTVTLTRPDGVVVTLANATKYLSLSSGVIISIDNPPRGAWTLAVGNSSDQTYVNVNGIADLAFSSFKLARFGAMPPHQGLLAIDGEPGPGQALYAIAALTGISSAPQFQLRRKNFELLSPLALEQDQTDNGKFFGALTVPNEAFVAYATGTDSSGFPYQRLVSVLVQPQTVSVTPPSRQDLRPGVTTTLTYQIRNDGPAGTFGISATDDQHYITSVSPTTLPLASGATANVTVTLAPPAGARIGSSDSITVTAQSSSVITVHNSASLTVFVTGAVQLPGRPDFVAQIVGQENVAPGVVGVDVRLTNTGVGTARDMTLSSLSMHTLSGSGVVTLNAALSPALPFVTPNVDVGSFYTVRLTFNVPSTVKRFSVSENGSVSDLGGVIYAYSQAQSIIPK
ncbi:MAG: hypothetical protein V4641_17215, partial [Pseudomonadota bacterium]